MAGGFGNQRCEAAVVAAGEAYETADAEDKADRAAIERVRRELAQRRGDPLA